MNILTATFECSAPDLESCPEGTLPEFAFIGRSNVGKSSLLNMLSGRPGLARVSPAPGHTRLINVFTVNNRWRLVDLPGYGFARVARKDQSRFNRAVSDYLRLRPNLCCVFTLIDSVLPPQKLDLEFIEWLADNEVPFVLVFTKIDLVKPAMLQATVKAFTNRLSEWCEGLPLIYRCSATTGQGRGALLGMIDEAIAPNPAEIVKASDGVREAKTKRPDLKRPW